MSDTAVMRVPADVHAESKNLAAIRGEQQGSLVARAWREYVLRHRDEFARDLEQAAGILRDGDLQDLASFVNQGNSKRAKRAAARLREPQP